MKDNDVSYIETEFDGFLGISLIPKETGFNGVLHIPFNDGVNKTPYVLYQNEDITPISISDNPMYLKSSSLNEEDKIFSFIRENKDLILKHWNECVDLVYFCDNVKGLKI